MNPLEKKLLLIYKKCRNIENYPFLLFWNSKNGIKIDLRTYPSVPSKNLCDGYVDMREKFKIVRGIK